MKQAGQARPRPGISATTSQTMIPPLLPLSPRSSHLGNLLVEIRLHWKFRHGVTGAVRPYCFASSPSYLSLSPSVSCCRVPWGVKEGQTSRQISDKPRRPHIREKSGDRTGQLGPSAPQKQQKHHSCMECSYLVPPALKSHSIERRERETGKSGMMMR